MLQKERKTYDFLFAATVELIIKMSMCENEIFKTFLHRILKLDATNVEKEYTHEEMNFSKAV